MGDLRPCEFPCEKCGSLDITRTFRREGDMWRVERYGHAGSKYAYANSFTAKSSRDHINHFCRCCKYEWQTLPMKRPKKQKQEHPND